MPAWVQNAVFYQIFPDRFAKSDRVAKPAHVESWDSEPTTFGYKGGDLRGIVEHLDYLQILGVTALYLNPIFQSASNHRYHTHDYYHVDPLLGGDEAFDALIAACDERNMRVVVDGVFNHASRGFLPFNDILENGQASPWLDWFNVTAFPPNAYDTSRPPDYDAWFGLHALPRLNTDNPDVREFIMRVGEHWIERGASGWRLDVPNEITAPGFWAEFRQRIKAVDPDAYIVGEIWGDSRDWLQGDQFDATMNYVFAESVIAFVGGDRVVGKMIEGRGYHPAPPLDGPGFADKIDWMLSLYGWPVTLAQLNLLDSHDTSRFLSIVGGDEAALRLALALQCTFPGAPCIYYGDEIGMEGGPSDALARRTFPWDHRGSWNTDLLDWYRQAIHLRHDYAALRTGAYHRLHAAGAVFAFGRTWDGQALVTIVNSGADAVSCHVPLASLGEGGTGVEARVLLGQAERVALADRSLTVEMPARSVVVLDVSPA